MPVFAYSRPYDEIYKKKEGVGEDENSKNVLDAANASRAKKITGPVSYFVRQVGTSLQVTLSSAILSVRNCGKN